MSEQRPVPPDSATREAAALRQTGALPLRPGDPGRVGPYVPVALLGSGGMGRVYLARPADDSPGLVAVKVIRPEYADDSRFRRRFEHEASVHAQVRTPHTPRLCGTGFQDELLWMATEYLPGLDLSDAVREGGALETAAVWRLVAELGRALADLAATGIVHRDLKPSNVLLSVRGAHVIDFGISKAADASAITGTGNRVGTPAYMSPEHLRTGTSDTASDVFSLAGTLVYAATGRAPFGDGTGVDVMHRVAFEEPNPELIGEISTADPALAALLSACLSKEPERRPTPQDLVAAAESHGGLYGEMYGGTCDWPEPVGGQVRARQRAYEVLYRLPVEPEAGGASGPGGPGQQPPKDEQKAAAAPQLPPAEPRTGARIWARKKSVLAVAAAIALCMLAAGVFVLMRQAVPATASSPGAGAQATAGATPGDAAFTPAPEASDGRSAPGTSGRSATDTDGGAARPEISNSPSAADDDGPAGPATPATDPSAPAEPSPSPTATPSSESPEPGTPPWISDCTYYSGNGLTRRGNSGQRVTQVQCMLTKRGYDVGSSGVDGAFGAGTESAVRGFQTDKGLESDGIVGHATWSALRSTE